MNGSGKFHIKHSAKFEKTQKKLVRTRYRKNKQGVEKFVQLMEKWLQILSVNPRPRSPLGDLEPWPDDTKEHGYELWKLKLKMPQLGGSAGEGRLIYLLDTKQREIVLVWIYTHAEFEKRPPEKELKQLLQEIINSQKVFDLDNNSTLVEDSETADSEVKDSETRESKHGDN